MKKYIAEGFGAMSLVLFGYGSVMFFGAQIGVWGIAITLTLLMIILVFAIGKISGCHLIPAVSLAMLLSGRMKPRDFGGYILAQTLGAAIGLSVLLLAVSTFHLETDATGFQPHNISTPPSGYINTGMTLLVEASFTFIMSLTVIGATDDNHAFDRYAGVTIGLALGMVNAVGIQLRNTSLDSASFQNFLLSDGWVVVVGPLIGAILSAMCWTVFSEYLAAHRDRK